MSWRNWKSNRWWTIQVTELKKQRAGLVSELNRLKIELADHVLEPPGEKRQTTTAEPSGGTGQYHGGRGYDSINGSATGQTADGNPL